MPSCAALLCSNPILKENHNVPKPTLRACLGSAGRYHALVWRAVSAGRRHLHFLPDRASLFGDFTAEQLQTLDTTFPQFVKQLESALKSGALDPRQSRRYSSILNGLTCEADTNGSHGYVYLTIYPAE